MYVYFIKTQARPGNNTNEMVKIGKSNDPYGRLCELQIWSPIKLRRLAIVQCQSDAAAYKVERLAHELFELQHKRGEWFLLGKNRERMLKGLAKRVAEAK